MQQQQIAAVHIDGDVFVPVEVGVKSEEGKERSQCKHFRKLCSRFYFSCCNKIDNCPQCHIENDCGAEPPEVASICCDKCDQRQLPSPRCCNRMCNTAFSKNFCSECLIWTESNISHCHKCKTCRVGEPDSMYHCETCDACFFVANKAKHRCLRQPLKDIDCPVCLEQLHLSTTRVDILRCGHVLHVDCLRSYLAHGVKKRSPVHHVPKCPVCWKCLLSPTDAQTCWSMTKRAIENTSQVQGRKTALGGASADLAGDNSSSTTTSDGHDRGVAITCFDCEKRSSSLFHRLDIECGNCKSFNTALD